MRRSGWRCPPGRCRPERGPGWGRCLPLFAGSVPYAVLRPHPPATRLGGADRPGVLTADPTERYLTINYAPEDTPVVDLSGWAADELNRVQHGECSDSALRAPNMTLR